MNNRIQELVLQAGGNFADSPLEFAVVFGELEDFEKFAELIVRECAKVAKDIQTFYDENNDSQVNTEIWTMIKQHFGVEE